MQLSNLNIFDIFASELFYNIKYYSYQLKHPYPTLTPFSCHHLHRREPYLKCGFYIVNKWELIMSF